MLLQKWSCDWTWPIKFEGKNLQFFCLFLSLLFIPITYKQKSKTKQNKKTFTCTHLATIRVTSLRITEKIEQQGNERNIGLWWYHWLITSISSYLRCKTFLLFKPFEMIFLIQSSPKNLLIIFLLLLKQKLKHFNENF